MGVHSVSVAFSQDGHILAVVRDDGTVKLWDMPSGTRLTTLTEQTTLGDPPSELQSVAFSPDGHTLAAGGQDGTVTLWDTVSWSKLRTVGAQNFSVTSVAFARDGRILAVDRSFKRDQGLARVERG